MNSKTLSVLLGLAGLTALGHTQSLLDVAFGTGAATPSGAAYLGAAGDQWNEVAATFGGTIGPQSLFASDGSASSATVSITCDGGVLSLATGAQPNPALTDYYAFNNTGGSINVTLSGLGADQAYQLVLYVASDDAVGGDRSVSGSVIGASTTSFTATGDPQTTFVQGENMVLLNVMSDSSGSLTLVESEGSLNTTGEVDLNGLQLSPAPVPEPATLSVVAFGAFTAWKRRRR